VPPLVITTVVLTSNAESADGQGTWAGEITGGNSATWTNGAIRYSWADIPNIANYDFVEIEYSTGSGGSVVWKQFNNGNDYGFVTNLYPTLSTDGGTFKFELRGAGTTNGLALQAHTNTNERSITVTKVTFTQGIRVTVTFDTDGGNTIAPITAVATTAIGPLPTPTKAGHTFAGWFDTEDEVVTSATVVDAAMTLKAHWNVAVTVTPITVDLSSGVTAVGGTLSAQTATGFTFTYTTNYAGAYAKFSVPLPTGASLAAYGSVTVTINGVAGDSNYKPVNLLAGAIPSSGSINPDPTTATHPLVMGINGNADSGSADERYTSGSQTRTIAIDAGKAGTLTGTVDLCIYLHANSPGGSPSATTVYTFSNVTLNVRD